METMRWGGGTSCHLTFEAFFLKLEGARLADYLAEVDLVLAPESFGPNPSDSLELVPAKRSAMSTSLS